MAPEIHDIHSEEAAYQEIMGKLQYLVDYMDDCGYLDDGIFTFPDGDYWPSTKTRNNPDSPYRDYKRGT